MLEADICIGAGGGSSWESCCLGLPSGNIALADNQMPGIQAMAEAGAAIGLPLSALQEPQQIKDALRQLMADYGIFSKHAAALCDGHGAARVVGAMSGCLRAVKESDAKLIFDWRNQAHIREASLNSDLLEWDGHVSYLRRVLTEADNHLWCIYQEDGLDLGLEHAKREDDGSGTGGL